MQRDGHHDDVPGGCRLGRGGRADAEAKAAVTEFLDSIGYDAHDAGPLAEGWRYQANTPAYSVFFETVPTSFDHMGPGRQVTAALLDERLRAARRGRDL